MKTLSIYIVIIFILLNLVIALQTVALVSAQDMHATKSAMKTIEYTLPYPGILPDNPLYKLKVLRDKIKLALIQEPREKIEFYLLLADKGMASTDALAKKGNIQLAKETAYKAEHNITELTFVYKKISSKPSKEMYQKVEKATKKHQEVLQNAMKKGSAEDKKAFEQVINFSKTNWNELQILYKKQRQTSTNLPS